MKNYRKTITGTITEIKGTHQLHFNGLYKLSGGKNTLNFPVFQGIPLHNQIESIMLVNKMCTNVTRVCILRDINQVKDIEITYNLPA
ncbi:hypothetical protein EHW64_18300 [Erwinia psidii]|uniref:hypothetical protein n=1 Tax=Erwinia psidii TaxID=69224 RepID=UPI00226B617B|nr:hypothetical protein [Erwinia psidii]MCX8959343.1 hypothetical protein [Erwinia psidii]MCX8963016.1 hypothetical protein [Erwinia psidii]